MLYALTHALSLTNAQTYSLAHAARTHVLTHTLSLTNILTHALTNCPIPNPYPNQLPYP